MSNTLFSVLSVAIVLYLAVVGIYRVLFHRVAHVPGPFLAKLTYLYEFYYDVVLGGQYIWKIEAMHERYGPILRINPDEVHIQDANFIDEVYSGPGRRRDKETYFQSTTNQSVFMTRDHDLHRMRRSALAPFFSMAKVRQLQPGIEAVIKNLLSRMEECRLSKTSLPASIAYTAMTNDIIAEYAFARCDNHLKAPEIQTAFNDIDRRGARFRHLMKHCPWLFGVFSKIPDSLLGWLNPEFQILRKLAKDIYDQVEDIYRQRDQLGDIRSRTTIFHDILGSSLPEHEKLPHRLYQDGRAVIAGGTLTTATALSEITFHLLRDPGALRRLKEEIKTVMPDPAVFPSLGTATQLPFLKAVVNEGLRLNGGVSIRLPRIATQETLEYTASLRGRNGETEKRKYRIPPGTTVMMTPLLIHQSPQYFDDPKAFRPQRWIDDPSLERYFMPFSRGSRQCIAMNLAWAEMILTLIAMFRSYGSQDVRFADDVGFLALDGTTQEDMDILGDSLTPFHRSTRRLWIRVLDWQVTKEKA